MTLHHGTCIVVWSAGVLLRGPSGSGKSDLAFRLIEAGDAVLVADDQTRLSSATGELRGVPSPRLAGLIEVRGLGILRRPHRAAHRIDLVIDLVGRDDVPRLPEPRTVEIMNVTLPLHQLCAFDASAPAKVVALAKLARAEPGTPDIRHV
jgi:serine kinase of HPr protein (carbohydrate metabolism regulator)